MLELSKGIQLANRYTLLKPLGRGGEAQLWLAKDRMTAASVALKIVAAHGDASERLRAEWQTSIRLMHAHIARAFEFHVEDDVAFYSQQFIDGPDIGVLSGMAPDAVLGPIGFIADALRYLHAKGLVHRDIKAANILIDSNGAPYLTDLGMAATIGDVGSGGSLIAQSPQSLNGEPHTPADDIFALGGLIYELIAGRSPYSSATTREDILDRTAPPLVSASAAEVPPPLGDLVARMLDKNAALRPDAASVAESLQGMGYTPGVATLTTVAHSISHEELIERVESIRPANLAGEKMVPAVATGTHGLSRTTTIIALTVLLAVLVGVVVFLPQRVSNEDVVVEFDDTTNTGGRSSQRDNSDLTVDPEIRKRLQAERDLPTRALAGEEITFSENAADYSGLDADGRARFAAESTLGELLSALEVLEGRGVDRWAPMEHRRARELYADGDQAYLKQYFAEAEESYLLALTALEPLYDRIEPTFQQALADGQAAFDAGERLDAIQHFEMAVAITPTHAVAVAGLERARNLESVLRLVDQGLEFEEDLDLAAAERSFQRAIEIDNLWQPAHDGLQRVQTARTKMQFDLRMSDGFEAIAAGDYLAARAAFRVAKQLIPSSTEPVDGLLQVDQGLRLQEISILEQEAESLQRDEHWDAVVTTYEEILKVDNTLSFAKEGLTKARDMSALHDRLDKLIAEPDTLSNPATMQQATTLVVEITTRADAGPRLIAQRDELSRLLKRAVTPLTVPLLSDNMTQVTIYRVGRLGNFLRTEVSLRPGTYVAVGERPGYRDVREEFRVAPEIELEPVVVQCEERI